MGKVEEIMQDAEKLKKSDSILFKDSMTLKELIEYVRKNGFNEIYRINTVPKKVEGAEGAYIDVKIRKTGGSAKKAGRF